jgi:glycerophosphoryl diester phosphodiesterase
MRRPAVIAHRAGPEGNRYPENSFAAVRAAMKLGVDGIEIDIRRSRDGVYFVYHDPGIPKQGPISELPAARLRKAGVPTLEEFLPLATRGLVFLDIKMPYPVRELVTLVSRFLPEERQIYGSFWHPFIRAVKEYRPALKGAITFEARLMNPLEAARLAKADILAMNHPFIDTAAVREAHKAGLQIYPWTANDPADIRRLQSLRVDAIITDYPSRLI